MPSKHPTSCAKHINPALLCPFATQIGCCFAELHRVCDAYRMHLGCSGMQHWQSAQDMSTKPGLQHNICFCWTGFASIGKPHAHVLLMCVIQIGNGCHVNVPVAGREVWLPKKACLSHIIRFVYSYNNSQCLACAYVPASHQKPLCQTQSSALFMAATAATVLLVYMVLHDSKAIVSFVYGSNNSECLACVCPA